MDWRGPRPDGSGRGGLCRVGVRAANNSILNHSSPTTRLRDTTALRRFSTITFEPLEQGIVLDFDINTVLKERDAKTVTVSAR